MANNIKEFRISTGKRDEFINITDEVQAAVSETGVTDGICHVFVPHTTAAVTVNEGADPAVPVDIIRELDKLIPRSNHFTHMEGNAAAHIKTSIIGCTESVFVKGGRLVLGRWQAIFFCEFDGPRTREVMVKVS